MTAPRPDWTFASDNTAGICPEALAALTAANTDHAAGYGGDPRTAEARQALRTLFGTDCEVFFVFNGTAANALALAAACRSYQGVFCHESAHLQVDECGAVEHFTGGAKIIPLAGAGAKLTPDTVAAALGRRSDVHFPRPGALSLTQATEFGTLYTPDETGALGEVARRHGITLHMDGARFANAAAAFAPQGLTPADLTWRVGVDVLSLGGTKNGMLGCEAVVFFNRELARDFSYRVKQSGQLASKQRYACAQWTAMLRDGAWLRHAAHANAMARRLAAGLAQLPGTRLLCPVEANGVFVRLSAAHAAGLEARGWQFLKFIGDDGYRFMCGWDSKPAAVDALLADFAAIAGRCK